MKFLSFVSLFLIVTGFAAGCAVAADSSARRPSPSLASLPAPAAAGALRILLVDDDLSDNNHNPGDSRQSPSDRIFRQLVSDAVGGDAKAWAIESVKPNASGPGIDRLRPYSLIVWYTGASYGGNPDNTAVLSIEDEKTVRRYLEEVGGVVILVSPGYLGKVLEAGSTEGKSNWPFLTEVMGVRGGVGLAQRFEAGTVNAADGASFKVGKGSATVESQFSTITPDGAAVVFTTLLNNAKKSEAPAAVATANAHGRGRIIYVGFTFENLAAAELAPAFKTLLAASGLQSNATASRPTKTMTTAPAAGPATVQVTGTPTSAVVSWTVSSATIVNASPGASTTTTARRAQAPATSVIVERLVPNGTPVRLTLASPDAVQVNDPGPLTPGQAVTYRVSVTDPGGATGSKEASYTPPLPKDPESLTASVQTDGSIVLTWPEVPGVANYRVQTSAPTSAPGQVAPYIVNRATEWRTPPLDATKRYWTVTSMYEPGGSLTAPSTWPRVATEGIPVASVPTTSVQFLSLPNGTGSASESEAHYRAQCTDPAADLNTCASIFTVLKRATNFEAVWVQDSNGMPTTPEWAIAAFTDLNDLGLGRRVNCIPRKGNVTLCWATSHGNIPAAGAIVNGAALASTSEQVHDIKSLNIIIISSIGAFFGTYENPGYSNPSGHTTPFDQEFSYASSAQVAFGTALDSQGRKSVPHACLSCHGGRFDTARKIVVGASLLPLIPAHLTFSSANARSAAEEEIRRINQIIFESDPTPAIKSQITSLYNGSPSTPGTHANDVAVPPGWASQPGLYRQVIAPYCGTCHFSQTGPLNFATFRNLQDNKQRIQRAVCTDHSMPHSERGFRRFWTEGGAVSLPGLLSAALGNPACPR